jgi:hypothetical protein
MFKLDPFIRETVSLLEECTELADQLNLVDDFVSVNQKTIQSALLRGLDNEDDGHNVALKLLKLQADCLGSRSTVIMRRSTIQRPAEESQFFLGVVSQVFCAVQEWMRLNSVDRITVETLPDLQEYITMDLLVKNGYRSQVILES